MTDDLLVVGCLSMKKIMDKEEIQFQKETFEAQRRWLSGEYKKAKEEKPKPNGRVYELENRIKSFEREVKLFNKREDVKAFNKKDNK